MFTKTAEFTGRAELFVDGEAVGAGDIPHFTPMTFSYTGGGLTCGYEVGPAIGDGYEAPFRPTSRSIGSSSTSPGARIAIRRPSTTRSCRNNEASRSIVGGRARRRRARRSCRWSPRTAPARRSRRRAHHRLRRRDAPRRPTARCAIGETIDVRLRRRPAATASSATSSSARRYDAQPRSPVPHHDVTVSPTARHAATGVEQRRPAPYLHLRIGNPDTSRSPASTRTRSPTPSTAPHGRSPTTRSCTGTRSGTSGRCRSNAHA